MSYKSSKTRRGICLVKSHIFVSKIFKYISTNGTIRKIFTAGGQRAKYFMKYDIDLKINDSKIPLIANPTFLGIKLDPKLKFDKHIDQFKQKMIVNLQTIRKIIQLKFNNSTTLGLLIYKATTRSILDFCHVIACTDRFDFNNKIQIFQNKSLKQIRYFRFKTTTATLHQKLKLELVKPRLQKLYKRFMEMKTI